MNRVLIIEDHETLREGLTAILEKDGREVYSASRPQEGLELFRRLLPELVITDLKMDGMDGIAVLQSIKDIQSDTLVILMTAFGSIETAVEAMKIGAYDFVTKPFSSDLIRLKVNQALDLARVKSENQFLKEERDHAKYPTMIANSGPMKEVVDLVSRAAPTDSTVLILGESGTGKEILAREIHKLSSRSTRAFVKTDCASLATGILESELFGHEKGAFTGAISRKIGRFELAHEGTLFLDEIGELSLELQTKLLRVLQDRSFERVGGTKTIHVNVRVLSATNKDLKKKVEEGSFREDLFYRLNVVPIHLPPLRNRIGDIAPLIAFFVSKFGNKLGRTVTIDQDAVKILSTYNWPGNIRELENQIERLVILNPKDEISVQDLPPELTHNLENNRANNDADHHSAREGLNSALEKLEKQMILDAYKKSGGVKSKMADILGIKLSALYYKLEKYGI